MPITKPLLGVMPKTINLTFKDPRKRYLNKDKDIKED